MLKVADNDAWIVCFSDFHELTQQLFCNVASLRRRVAQVRRDGCVRAVPMFGRPFAPRRDHQVLQAKGILP